MRTLASGVLIAAAFGAFVWLETRGSTEPGPAVTTAGAGAEAPARAQAGEITLRHIHAPRSGVCLTLVSSAFSGHFGTVRAPCTDKFIARAETAR